MNVKFTPATMHGSQAGMKKDLRFTPTPCGNNMDSVDKGKDYRFVPSLPQNLAVAGHSIRGGTRFVPAQARGLWVRDDYKFVPSAFGIIDRTSEKFKKEYTLDWWTESALFNYSALLVSAYYGMDIWEFREHYKIPRKDFLFIADSGGWQITTQKVKIDAHDILRWQEHNADVGLTLDVPPVYAESRKVYTDMADFQHCVEMSKKNCEIMHRSWKSEDLELLKVIHGVEPEQLDIWYKAHEDLEFSGLAFSPKPPNEMSIATLLAYGIEKEAKKVHMFTGTGLGTSPVVIYAKKYFERLTYDSSTFSSQGAKMRAYFMPQDLSGRIMFGRAYNSTFKRLPCTCPVCQLSTIDDMNAEGSCPGGLIALHNLWVYLMYCNFIDSLADSKPDLMEYLRKNEQYDAIKAIEFIDLSIDIGFYDAYNKVYREGQAGLTDVSSIFE